MTKRIIIIDTDMSAKDLHEALCLSIYEGDTSLFGPAIVEDIVIVGQFDLCPETGAMTSDKED